MRSREFAVLDQPECATSAVCMTSAALRALQCTLSAAYGAKLRVIFSSISPACATGRSKMRILTCTFNPRHSYGAKRKGEVQVFFSGTLCLRCTHHVTSAPSLHSHWLFEVALPRQLHALQCTHDLKECRQKWVSAIPLAARCHVAHFCGSNNWHLFA